MTPNRPSFPRRSRAALWLPSLLLGLASAPALLGCGEPQPEPTPSVTQARSNANGTTVTVEGHVTVQPGAFVSALGDEGFALQDSSGGIYVKVLEKLSFGLGAKVRVTGVLDEQNKLRIIKAEPANVQQLQGTTQQVSPKDVSTGAVTEAVEGSLIRVTGNVTQTFKDDSPYGYKVYINDGSGEVQIFVHIWPGYDPAPLQALTAGQSITVVGLAAQYEDTYEVAPRLASDITIN